MDWGSMVKALSDAIGEQAERLNALDSTLGDGDHGTSLAAGFTEAARRVAAIGDVPPADAMRMIGSALLNAMGGSSGALYGTLFLRAGHAAGEALDSSEAWADALQAGLDGVRQRGGAQRGDKTMVDALEPAVAALATAASSGQPVAQALAEAAIAARAGAEATAAMVARHGRAKFVGERAIGHADAGAQSVAVVFDALARWWKENAHA
ncbi:MAG: dihydroxyacetone kinase subunit L [Chloroflexi bacterium]|nr:dihydroxyacetone kinase subunit L [Chloroflexota bacterium]